MATVSYKCNVCKRDIELVENERGMTTFSRCIITDGCRGKLIVQHRNPDNMVRKFATEVPGLKDFILKNNIFNFVQTTPQYNWIITHNLNSNPVIKIYINDSNGTSKRLSPNTYSISFINSDRLIVTFSQNFSGIAQLISRTSQPTNLVTAPSPIVDSLITSKGTFIFAIPQKLTKFTYPPTILPYPTLPLDLYKKVIKIQILITKPAKEPIQSVETLDFNLTGTPWSNWPSILVRKRKNYYILSKNILKFVTFGNPYLTASDIPDNTTVKITGIDYGTGVIQPIDNEGLLLLTAKPPFYPNDKIINSLINIGDLQSDSDHGFVYKNGDLYLNSKNISNTYPDIQQALFKLP